jgi:5'-3' exonuclease
MMNIYRDILPKLGGYLTDKAKIHLPRVELFIQEIARREPLYFQQRSIDEKEKEYAGDGYKDHYYKVRHDHQLLIQSVFASEKPW